MGVRCDRIRKPFTADLDKLTEIPAPALQAPDTQAPYILLDSRTNASYAVVFALHLVAFDTGELIEAEFEDRVDLALAEDVAVALHRRLRADQDAEAFRRRVEN